MPIMPAGFVNQTQLAAAIEKAVKKLPSKDVVRVRYSLGIDSTGEASLFFRILLTDAASQEDDLAEVTGRIATILFEELRPQEQWGLLPYFSYRSRSEQSFLNDPDWA